MFETPQPWLALERARIDGSSYVRDVDALISIAHLLRDVEEDRSAIGVEVRVIATADGTWDVDGRILTT